MARDYDKPMTELARKMRKALDALEMENTGWWDHVGADVGTDVATIWAISPEQLQLFIEDLKITPDMGWGEWADRLDEFEKLLRQHGGAVFHTEGDGIFNIKIVPGKDSLESDKAKAKGKGYLKPYGSSAYTKWREKFKSAAKPKPGDPGFREWAEAQFEILVRNKGIEARHIQDQIEMYAWEAGYEDEKVRPWFVELGKIYDIDVRREWRDGARDSKTAGIGGELENPDNMDDDVVDFAVKKEREIYDNPETAEEIAKWTLMQDSEYYERMNDVNEKGYHPMLHVGTSGKIRILARGRVAGILDIVKDKRMDWLWAYNPKRDELYVKKDAMDQIENLFYDHMAKVGFPQPVHKWVLAMAIVGGAASLQWKDDSDVDVSVIVDWLKMFKEMERWSKKDWEKIGLENQYDRIQRGQRIRGKLVAKAVRDALWGFGHFKGDGIIERPDLNRIAPSHPINYRIMRRLHQGDLRFDKQPPVVEGDSISAYIAEFPIKRRREEEGTEETEINWIQRARDLPTGFSLKRDVPTVYDEALGYLRYMIMPFDFLWAPKKPDDIPKALGVLKKRYDRVKHKLRTRGYLAYQKDPNAHSFVLDGEVYTLPDAFAANVAFKLLESVGGEEAVMELLFKTRGIKNKRWVRQNFTEAKDTVRKLIFKPYQGARDLLKDYSQTIQYDAPYPTKL